MVTRHFELLVILMAYYVRPFRRLYLCSIFLWIFYGPFWIKHSLWERGGSTELPFVGGEVHVSLVKNQVTSSYGLILEPDNPLFSHSHLLIKIQNCFHIGHGIFPTLPLLNPIINTLIKFVSNVNEGLWGLGSPQNKMCRQSLSFRQKIKKKILLEVTRITKEISFFSSFV